MTREIKLGDGRLPPRFWSKVEVSQDGYWLWTAAKFQSGYGMFGKASGKMVSAHRWAYLHLVGPIPDDLTLDHTCRVRACCRPTHLEPVTNRENVLRGVGPTAVNARKTHCPNGHEYTVENTRIFRNSRSCRICNAATWKRLYERDKPEVLKRARTYYYDNLKIVHARGRIYREENRDKIRAYQKQNKEALKAGVADYCKRNRVLINAKARVRHYVKRGTPIPDYVQKILDDAIANKPPRKATRTPRKAK